MLSVKKTLGLALLATAGMTATAQAQVSGNVALTINYVWRGQTQSEEEFAVQGGMDVVKDMFYAGAWASSVEDFGIDASTELDLYAGITPTLGPLTFNLGVIGYFYPNANADSDFIELRAGASYAPIEALSLGLNAFASNDYLATGGDSLFVEATVSYAITEMFAISGGYGAFDQDTLGAYDTWNIGGSVALHGFKLDLRYFGNQGLGLDEQVSVTLSRAL
jgi:uncharacterized protein (TIGR02001 family)